MKRLGAPPFICLITEGRTTPENYDEEGAALIDSARAASADGVDMIQIREKALGGRMLYDLARQVIDAVRGSGARVFLNDRADVAVAAGAHGVHLPERSLPPAVVAAKFPDLLLGVSSHSLQAARDASTGGADYVFFGPIFDTPDKGQPVGIAALADVCRGVSGSRVIALGGIDETNCHDAIKAGAAGVAAIRALNDPESRRRICRLLKSERQALS